MRLKLRVALAVAGAAALVTGPSTAAQADDFRIWSTSGKTYAYHDDAADRMVVCDQGYNDGWGAHLIVRNQFPEKVRTFYNGCEYVGGIIDGWWSDINVCDWVSQYGERRPANCNHAQFLA